MTVGGKGCSTWLFATAVLLCAGSQILHRVAASENQHYLPSLQCYDPYGRPQRCIPAFENAAFLVPMEATNTCGEEDDEQTFCVQTGFSNRKSCDKCYQGSHSSSHLTDLHDPNNQTWWQSETMYEGIQYPSQVNLTLNLGKSFDITYIRIVFYAPRPESFAIYKRSSQNGPWTPYQYYSATCRETYSLPDFLSVKKGEDESRALCTSEYSDISPLRDGNVAFSSLEGRPSAISFDHSVELQNWVTATDIRIVLDRLNTFGDEVFGDTSVLQSYFYAIADVAVGARCKCNGHASDCVVSSGINGERTRVCDCKHNTDGPDCEKCLPLFNDAPWGRATSKNVHECKPCNCNGHSNKCFFDRHLYNQTGHGGHCLDCQRNRDGPNCERCKENFVMRSDGYCINCDCNPVGSRSLQCNSEGKCHCKPGVTGEKCDQCEDNYFNFGSKGCTPCECDSRGSLDNKPNCHPETGVCVCKDNVEGRRCKECKPGFFNLDLDNRFGCTPCFCYGHTSECQSAMGYTQGSTTSNFNKQNERWTVVDEYNRPADVKYNKYSKNIGITAQGHQQLYFSAPDRFLGDQRASYNRQLKFRLQLIDQSRPSPAVDVILEGAGTRISLPIFAQHNSIPDQEFREYKFQLHESSDYYWQPSQSSRGFMSILTNLTAIKIRGTFATTGEAVLDDVELQTAYRGSAGRPATWIEQCTCPPGYLGQFCESCAPGFRHSPARGGPFMTCIPCDCNKHADICDSDTGRCICKHNTTGDTCDQCAKGYYGNALVGSEYDCKRCPCMENGACLQMGEEVICLECPVGYFGPRCEQCADGYFGNPNGQPVQLCQACDCNGNVDLNAVGNCNRTTGECLKCIHNTAGPRCDQCLPGHYGDPLSLPHGNCEACSCYPQGTEQTEDGVSICEQLSGSCRCKPNVVGRNCNECQAGFFNINSGNGCESCGCDPIGSYNATCERFSGQCYCKPGVTGLRCDQCEQYQYGFSTDGCMQCDCDESGSKGFQCDEYGQCPCNDNVEGRRCDRCKENKFDRHSGCVDCPHCYNLVQDAADEHREKLHNLSAVLAEIASKPTVIDDAEFDSKLRVVQEKINILTEDAKSGAGGEDRTLVERLNDLRHRLTAVRDELQKSDTQQHSAGVEIERASEHVTRAEEANVAVRRLLDTALELLQTDGIGALAKAKDRSDQFGSQSDQISHISRESRNIIADLEQQSSEKKENAKEAQEKSVQAYELAKNTFALQANISAELRSTIRSEIALAKDNLEATKRATTQALNEANEVYDKALTLLTSVNTIAVPQINIEKLKKDAILAGEYAERLRNRTVNLEQEHDALLTNYDDSSMLANTLIERSKEQESDAVGLLEHVKEIHRAAVEAVALGDNTLAEAKKTYETLSGFQAQVAQSSQNARTALDTVPAIDDQIQKAIETVNAATDALEGASQNAETAKVNAEAAQKKFAEQASKDAETIRGEANQTKSAAQKLHSEADHLSGRVQMTDARIEKIAKQAEKDDILAREASEKVNQAKTDSADAKRQAERASKEVDAIVEELNRLKDINLVDLDALEKRLKDAEDKVSAARLSKRMESLVDNRNQQNSFVREHQHTIGLLKLEVDNIRQISESLPAGCYKRTRLEV